MAKKNKIYIAATALQSDKLKKVWQQGDEVSAKDFPKSVLKVWLQQGIIEEVEIQDENEIHLEDDEAYSQPDVDLVIEDDKDGK